MVNSTFLYKKGFVRSMPNLKLRFEILPNSSNKVLQKWHKTKSVINKSCAPDFKSFNEFFFPKGLGQFLT